MEDSSINNAIEVTASTPTKNAGRVHASAVERFIEDNARLSALLRDAVIGIDDVTFLEFARQTPNATQAELASKASFSRSGASRIMIRLIDFELLSERLSRADMRASRLKVTARGENVLIEASHTIGSKTLETFAAHAATFNAACRELRIDRSCALIILSLGPDKITQSTSIATQTALKATTLSSAVQRLRSKGLARTTEGFPDKRKPSICLTREGKLLAAKIAHILESAASNTKRSDSPTFN